MPTRLFSYRLFYRASLESFACLGESNVFIRWLICYDFADTRLQTQRVSWALLEAIFVSNLTVNTQIPGPAIQECSMLDYLGIYGGR